MMFSPADIPFWSPAAAEIVMFTLTMLLLMIGVFRYEGNIRLVSGGSIALLLVCVVIVMGYDGGRMESFSGQFIMDDFAAFTKILVLCGAALSILLSLDYLVRQGMRRFEFPVLVLLSTLGMLVMLSANDLMTLYLGLELQSLPLYVLAAMRRESLKSSEAGIKYFVLGALSSGILLYGMSMVYGFTGTTNFDLIANAIHDYDLVQPGLVLGFVFMAAGLGFKISAVPFHMWTPDVYEGAPTPVTAFFAIAPKIAAMALIIRVFMGAFHDLADQWQQVIMAMSVLSMIVGAFAAIVQTNIKRLMAYSSIGHMGYALIGLAAGTTLGVKAILIYMAIYMIMSIGTFSVILSMQRKERMVEDISELSGLGKTQPGLAAAMAVFMFSMAGIPPLAGFFGKLYIFQAAIAAELYWLAVIGVLTSVVSAYYYLRVIKVMYFDEETEGFDRLARERAALILASVVFLIIFIAFPMTIIEGAGVAAATFSGV